MKLFLTSQASETLDKLLPLLDKAPAQLKVAFIPTAADPYEHTPWMDADKQKLQELGFQIFEVNLGDKSEDELIAALTGVDIIFVAGGNTFYLLQKARESGFDKVLKDLLGKGVVYIGSSAGSVITGPDLEAIKLFDDPKEEDLESSKAFGLVDFVILPHYKKEKYIERQEKVLKDFGAKYKFIPITDRQAVYVDDNGYRIIEA